jgi:hypothetical protein
MIWGAHYRINQVVVPEKSKDAIGGSICGILTQSVSCSDSSVGRAVASQPKEQGFEAQSKFKKKFL